MQRVNYTNIENGRRNLTSENLQKLAKRYGVSTDVVLGIEEVDNPKAKKTRLIPILGRVPAGYPSEAVEYILDYIEVNEDVYKLGELFGLVISGDSMEPEIREGDVAIVLQSSSIASGKIGVVRINGDDVTVKKVLLENKGISLVPLNKRYGTLHFTDAQVEELPVSIVGRVIEIRRKLDFL